jgi:hypothetical protein
VIPAWKLRREIGRLRQHFWALSGLAYEPILKLRHDRWRRALPQPEDGGVPLGPKVAVFLLYQPRGIARSVLITLRHLVDNGYTPLIISNAPLSAVDRDTLHPLVWRMIERPNFGYDFGGYRDGILLLDQWGVRPERLLVLNDSIWLPLAPGSTLITRMETASGDVIGTILHPDKERRRVVKSVRRGFVESYLYAIDGAAMQSPVFKSYWQRYRVSSNKFNAVRLGERGFSKAMRKGGLRVVGLFSADTLVEALDRADDDTLSLTLKYGVYTEDDLAAQGAALRARTPDETWRREVLAHVRRTTTRRRFNASFPYPSLSLLGMDFMKRSTGPTGAGAQSLHVQMRMRYLDAVAAGDLPPPYKDVLDEIRASIPGNGA